MNAQKLYAEALEKRTAINVLLAGDEPDMEQIKALQAEAQSLTARADAMAENEKAMTDLKQPVMPAPLPIDADPEPQPQPSQRDNSVKALYTLQYGNEDNAVKAILTDLHGADYEQKRLNQWQGFVRYLRTGGLGESREFLWTPQAIKVALADGQDVRAMKTVMVEASDTLGGYIVPEDFRMQIVSRMAALTVVRGRADPVTTSRDSVEFPKATGGDSQYANAVRVTWVDETPTAGTAVTNLTWGIEKVPVHTVMAEAFLSRNLMEDAAFNIIAYLSRAFAEAQAIDEDNQFLVGDGNGKPEGILKDSGVGVLGSSQVVNSGVADALAFDGLIALTYGLDAQYRQNAVFIGEKATMLDIAQLKDSNGQYLWRDMFGVNAQTGGAGTQRSLLGYPVLEQEAMPSVAANAYVLLFGDLNGYKIVDRVGMSVERYLDSATARINQACFIARRRLGGQCVEPWRFVVQRCHT